MAPLQLCKKFIDGEGLLVDSWAIIARGLKQELVVIPLDVGNVIVTENLVDRFENVAVCTWVGEVNNVLPSSLRWHAVSDLENPIRMFPINIAVGVQHLPLKPEPKLHTRGLDLLNESPETLRPNLIGHLPITKTLGVVSPRAEPTIVQNEALNANLLSDIGKLRELLEVVIEIHSFPKVQSKRPGPDV